jgi:hypothetical protein
MLEKILIVLELLTIGTILKIVILKDKLRVAVVDCEVDLITLLSAGKS